MMNMKFIKIANLKELSPGERKTVVIKEHKIALFNIDGKIYAIDNMCPHMGGPLGEGDVNEKIITCPLHGWQFDVESGESLVFPKRIRTYEVKVEGNEIFVEI